MRYLFLIGVLCLAGCRFLESKNEEVNPEDVKDGVAITKLPDGTIYTEIPMKNGKKNGRAKIYSKGKVRQEVDYVDDVRHGEYRHYYESGVLYKVTPFVNNKEHGIEKRYRKDGLLSAEIPYNNGVLCMGLQEYLLDGSPKTDYPSIVITPVDNMLLNGEYKLIITMSNGSKSVEFFNGKLEDGGCLSADRKSDIKRGKRPGSGEINYFLYAGDFIMEEINIIAKMKTVQGNYYITKRKYNVAIENRF